MAIGTLASIIQMVRELTGSANDFQLTDAQIKDRINSFYLFDFPARFRSLKLKDKYTFDTIRGIDTYAFDSERYTTVQMPCYCMKRSLQLYTDQSAFYGSFTNWQNQQALTYGDGGAGPYIGLATGLPIIRSVNNDPSNINYPAGRSQNLLITANTANGSVNVTDNGFGILYQVDDAGVFVANVGTVDYQTGAFAFTYSAVNIPAGNPIQLQYSSTSLAIPQAVLYFQNAFIMRPIPDRGYTVELTAYRQPTQAMEDEAANLGTPEYQEWWETIAYGAAKKIYERRLDPDGIGLMNQGLEERYALNETRTYAQLGSQRIGTMFTNQLQNTYGNGIGIGWGSGGNGI